MRLGVWLTRRQIRAVAALVERHGTDALEIEALQVLKQVEVDDPPPKHGPKCACGHMEKSHYCFWKYTDLNAKEPFRRCRITGCMCGR